MFAPPPLIAGRERALPSDAQRATLVAALLDAAGQRIAWDRSERAWVLRPWRFDP